MGVAEQDPVPRWLLVTLNAIGGVTARAGMRRGELKLTIGKAPPITFLVEFKTRASLETVLQWVRRVRHERIRSRRIPLLIVRRIPESARRVLRDAGLSWIEQDTGVQHLFGPGLLVDRVIPVEDRIGADREDVHKRPVLLQGRTGVLAEMLLEMRKVHTIQVGTLAAKAQASPALASRVLQRLEKERLVEAIGAGPRKRWRLLDAPALLDLWIGEERDAEIRTPLHVWARSPYDRYERLSMLTESGFAWALGGVAAADLFAPTLSTAPDPDVWIQFTVAPGTVAETLNGEVVKSGANMYLCRTEGDPALRAARQQAPLSKSAGNRAVRDLLNRLSLVSPARACLEATRAGGRGEEVAQSLRQDLFSKDDGVGWSNND